MSAPTTPQSDGHRVGVATEAIVEAAELLVHHGVAHDAMLELVLLGLAFGSSPLRSR